MEAQELEQDPDQASRQTSASGSIARPANRSGQNCSEQKRREGEVLDKVVLRATVSEAEDVIDSRFPSRYLLNI